MKALEQRDRHDSTGCDGRQTFKVLVPIANRGLRKKVHEEFQQYLDLVDWSGIGVEDRTRECKATGEWFVTEEGRMPEALVSLAGEAGDPGSTV